MAIASPPTEPAARGPQALRELRPHRRSLRRRLAAAFAILALLIALGQAIFVWFVGYRAEEQLIDRVVAEQLQRSIALHWRLPELAAPNTPDMSLYVVRDDDAAADAALPSWVRELPRVAGTREVHAGNGIEYHVAMTRDRDAWFYLVYDVAEHETRQRNEIAALALSVIAIAAVAMLVSRRLARGMTRDLEGLSVAVADEGHGVSLGALAAHTETGRLADALDAYRARLREALGRERAFSAAASHELRTPLMRASSSLDLLRVGSLDERQRELVDRVQASVDDMTMLTGALLRVARGQVDAAAVEVCLEELAAEALAHLEPEARACRIALSTTLPGNTRFEVDRSALWIVLTNLLRNAIRHSQGSKVVVGWRDHLLTVEDDGVGIDGGWRRDFPAAGSSGNAEGGGSGLGLGLTIVERVCEAAGWGLTVEPREGGGTRVAIELDRG